MILTNEDIRMIKYFGERKGDVTRWCDWEKKLPIIEKELPGLYKAWRDLQGSELIFAVMLESLSERDDDRT